MQNAAGITLLVVASLFAGTTHAVSLARPEESMGWWTFKTSFLAFGWSLSSVPLAIGLLLVPPGERRRDLGATILGSAGFSLMAAYIVVSLFAMNEEVRKLDRKYDFRADDYCFYAATTCFLLFAGLLLYRTGSRQTEPAVEESDG